MAVTRITQNMIGARSNLSLQTALNRLTPKEQAEIDPELASAIAQLAGIQRLRSRSR